MPPIPTDRSWLRPALLVVLTLITVAAMWPVVNNGFVNWDDRDQITENPDFHPVRLRTLLAYLGGPYRGTLYPVSYLTMGALAAAATDDAGRIDPRVFHVASLVLHVAAALAAFAVLRVLVPSDAAAAVGAMVWAVHPVQVESVAWATSINGVLCGVFSFLALRLYLRAAQATNDDVERGWRSPGVWHRYAGATVLFVLAMLSKPSAITLPFIAGVLHWYLTREPARRIAGSVIVWLALAAPLVIVTRGTQTLEFVTPTPLWSRPIVAADAVAFYLYKLVAPLHLLVDYGRSPAALMRSSQAYWTWVVTAVAAAACWAFRRRVPWFAAAAGVFVAGLLPVLGLVPFMVQMFSTVTDRYLYLSMLGPALAVAWIVHRYDSRRPAVVYALAVIVVALLVARSNFRAADWRDELTLFGTEVRLNPRSVAGHEVLGFIYAENGRDDLAVRHYETALALKPDFGRIHFNLANILRRTGRLDEAVEHYAAALATMPGNADVHNNLGVALGLLGRGGEAAAALRRAVELRPSHPEARRNLELILRPPTTSATAPAAP